MAQRGRQRATLHDVAAQAGVSARTVSRVVNDEGGFSAGTRQRVLDAIDDLNYRPNLLARSLVTNRSDTFALIVPVIDDPFFPELAQGVQVAARRLGLTIFLAVTDNDAALEREVLDRATSRAIDGAILFPAEGSVDEVKRFASQGVPMVVVDHPIDHPNVCCVGSDLEGGVVLAVQHLRDRGRNRLAMLSNSWSRPVGRGREHAFRTLAGGDQATVVAAAPTYDGGVEATRELLALGREVDGLFAYNDMMAIGAIATFHEAGLVVPDDVAVVGCDDVNMSARVTPALTTIRLDRQRLGDEAVARLVELSETGVRPDDLTLPVTLVTRDST